MLRSIAALRAARRCASVARPGTRPAASATQPVASPTGTSTSLPPDGTEGWAWGLTIDGRGGGAAMSEWDPLATQLLLGSAPLGGVRTPLYEPAATVPDHARAGCWVHLDFDMPKAIAWLASSEQYLDNERDVQAMRLVVKRLTTLDPNDAPRFFVQRWGGEPNARTCAINFVLRSVLFDPAKPPAERAKAVAMRLRLSSKMLLSARHSDYIGLSVRTDMLHGHEVAAARDGRGQRLRAGLLDGDGARSTGDLFAEIVELIVERCIPAVSALEQDVYDLRARLFRAKSRAKPSVAGPKLLPIRELSLIRDALAPRRQEAIWLLRYLRPQRDALDGLLRWAKDEDEVAGGQELLRAADVARVREATFKLGSLIDQLDALGDSGAVLQEELVALTTEVIASSDNKIAQVGLALSVLVLVQVGVDLVEFAHAAGLVDLNAVFGEAAAFRGRF